jgi:hypothetical protein
MAPLARRPASCFFRCWTKAEAISDRGSSLTRQEQRLGFGYVARGFLTTMPGIRACHEMGDHNRRAHGPPAVVPRHASWRDGPRAGSVQFDLPQSETTKQAADLPSNPRLIPALLRPEPDATSSRPVVDRLDAARKPIILADLRRALGRASAELVSFR